MSDGPLSPTLSPRGQFVVTPTPENLIVRDFLGIEIVRFPRGKTTPEEACATLVKMVDHIDHVCQLAGNARHVAIGTDLDGGLGKEQSPLDLDTIADLQKVPDLLRQRGYDAAAIEGIMYGNWLRFFREAWAD